MLWVLKFPLDEQGCLVFASRDYLLRRIYEAIGKRSSHQGVVRSGMSIMSENPFAFRPDDSRLAVFRAKSNRFLKLPPSTHYVLANQYFGGTRYAQEPLEAWKEIGLQGVADFAVRLPGAVERSLVAARIRTLPAPPFIALCTCLESATPPNDIANALAERTYVALCEHESASLVAAGVRGVGGARGRAVGRRLLGRILETSYGTNVEVQAAVAARAWEWLEDPTIRSEYLECLSSSGPTAFKAIVTDLLFMPRLRKPMLDSLRDPNGSPTLRDQFDTLVESMKASLSTSS